VPDPRSAFASVADGALDLSANLVCEDRPFTDLVFVSAWPDTETKVFDAVANTLGVEVPNTFHEASVSGAVTMFRIAPRKIMIVSEDKPLLATLSDAISPEDGCVTELSQSRARLRLSGSDACALLARGAAVDLCDKAFPAAHFAQTSIHHIPILIHRTGDADLEVDVYVLRSFALSFWHWITETADIAAKAPNAADRLAY